MKLLQRPRFAAQGSIQTRLQVLVLVILIPMVALWAWYIHGEAQEAQHAAYAQVSVLVQSVATATDALLSDYEALIKELAEEYQGAPPRISTQFDSQQFLRLHQSVLAVGVRDLDGKSVYDSVAPALSAEMISSSNWGAAGKTSEQFNASGAFFGPTIGRWVTVLTYPVRDAAGQRSGFVYLALDLAVLNQRLLAAVPQGIVMPVIDRENRFLMRSAEPDVWIGKTLPPANVALIEGRQSGHFSAIDVKGVARLYAMATLPRSGWRVFAGVTQEQAFGAVYPKRNTAIVVGLLTAVGMLLLIWWRSKEIVKPIQELAIAVNRIKTEPSHRVDIRGPLEVEKVAQQLNALLDRIEQQHQDRLALSSHYASIIAHARDIVLLFNAQGFIIDANAAALAAYGYSVDELHGLRAVDLRSGQAKDNIETDWRAACHSEGVLFETVHQRKDGTAFNVEVSSSAMEIDGQLYRQSFVRDISDRKRIEFALQRRTRALGALSACNHALVTANTLQSLLDEVCSVIVQKSGYRMAWIGQAQDGGNKVVRPIANAGIDDGYLAQLHVTSTDGPSGRGPTGTAVREVRTVVAHNLATQPDYSLWRESALQHGYNASIALPLVVNGSTFGALTVYSADKDSFDPPEVQLLEELSRNLAFGIANLRSEGVREGLEKQLGSSEARFRMLIEHSPAGIYVIRDDAFVYANPRMESIMGFDSGALVGKIFKDIVEPEDWPIVVQAIRHMQVYGSTGNLSVKARRRDGVLIELGLQDVLADYEGAPAIIGMAQDISERNRTQAEIQRYVARLERTAESTLQAVSAMVEKRDPYTAGHERRVGELAGAIGREMALTDQQVRGLRLTGFVHDIGKIAVPAELLAKPTRLSDAEMALIRVHAQAGYDVLKDVEFPWPIADVILQHHERVDGSGYPQGLKGDTILLEARIMMVADVVESMSSHRPYRPGLGIEAALAEIINYSGVRYDKDVVEACVRLFREKAYKIDFSA